MDVKYIRVSDINICCYSTFHDDDDDDDDDVNWNDVTYDRHQKTTHTT